jgi:hypothetical protein
VTNSAARGKIAEPVRNASAQLVEALHAICGANQQP